MPTKHQKEVIALAKEQKTNVMRILDKAKIPYTAHYYEHNDNEPFDQLHNRKNGVFRKISILLLPLAVTHANARVHAQRFIEIDVILQRHRVGRMIERPVFGASVVGVVFAVCVVKVHRPVVGNKVTCMIYWYRFLFS